MIHFYKIDKNGFYQDLYLLDSPPLVEIDGELIPDPSYISTPIPNDLYVDVDAPPKWTGTEWVATGEPPGSNPLPPSEIERLAALEDAVMMITLMSL